MVGSCLIWSSGEGKGDNYAYLVVDDKSKDAVIIDPAHPEEYDHPSLERRHGQC